jgi:hypothetical protein
MGGWACPGRVCVPRATAGGPREWLVRFTRRSLPSQVMEEIIAKSRMYRALKAQQREEVRAAHTPRTAHTRTSTCAQVQA